MSALIPITIKSLSGEILSLQIPIDFSIKAFYYYVHSQLDPAIRPTLVQQLTLLRSPSPEDPDQDQQKQDHPNELDPTDSHPLQPMLDEIFFLLIDPHQYHADFDPNVIFSAQIHDEPWRSSYTYYVMRFYRNGELIHREPALYDNDQSQWFHMEHNPHQVPSPQVQNQEPHEDENEDDNVVYIDRAPTDEEETSVWEMAHWVAIHTLQIPSNSALLVAYFADAAWNTIQGKEIPDATLAL